MALQSLVVSYICQCIRKSRRSKNMVDQALDKLDTTKLRNVYARWKLLVLDMIIKNEGGAEDPGKEEDEEISREDIDSNDLDLQSFS